VDLDRLDDLLARWCPEVDVPLPGGGAVSLKFRELDDFRPERIAESPALDRLRESERTGRPAAPAVPAGLLDRVLGGAADEEIEAAAPGSPFAESLRAALHSPAVRELEAAWRGVEFLVKRLDLDGTGLEIHLLDVSRAELEEALLEGDAAAPPLRRLLAETPGSGSATPPWAALVLLESFGAEADEMRLVARLAALGTATNTPVLAGASARLLGCESLEESPDPDDWSPGSYGGLEVAWAVVRHLPESSRLALALPRFLLRLPYGGRTASVEGFEFEELSSPPRHEEYLWGSSSLFLALLLGLAFSEAGWKLTPGDPNGIGGLPLAFEEEDGESVAKPCAEAVLTIRAAEAIGEAGLVPLLTIRGTDAVKAGIFGSIAEPWAPLGGRWSPGER
jgi:type VI secretion system protein ImpC